MPQVKWPWSGFSASSRRNSSHTKEACRSHGGNPIRSSYSSGMGREPSVLAPTPHVAFLGTDKSSAFLNFHPAKKYNNSRQIKKWEVKSQQEEYTHPDTHHETLLWNQQHWLILVRLHRRLQLESFYQISLRFALPFICPQIMYLSFAHKSCIVTLLLLQAFDFCFSPSPDHPSMDHGWSHIFAKGVLHKKIINHGNAGD